MRATPQVDANFELASTLARLCPNASAAALREAAALFEPLALEKGDVLVRQATVWDQAVFVEHGMLRMYFADAHGKEFNKNFHGEGALVFPVTAAMQEQPSIFEMAALERTVVWRARFGLFQQQLEALACWDALRCRMLERLITGKLQREHDLLTLNARSRYRKLCTEAPDLAHRVPLLHLASYLGMTNVSLSRLRRSRGVEG